MTTNNQNLTSCTNKVLYCHGWKLWTLCCVTRGYIKGKETELVGEKWG